MTRTSNFGFGGEGCRRRRGSSKNEPYKASSSPTLGDRRLRTSHSLFRHPWPTAGNASLTLPPRRSAQRPRRATSSGHTGTRRASAHLVDRGQALGVCWGQLKCSGVPRGSSLTLGLNIAANGVVKQVNRRVAAQGSSPVSVDLHGDGGFPHERKSAVKPPIGQSSCSNPADDASSRLRLLGKASRAGKRAV